MERIWWNFADSIQLPYESQSNEWREKRVRVQTGRLEQKNRKRRKQCRKKVPRKNMLKIMENSKRKTNHTHKYDDSYIFSYLTAFSFPLSLRLWMTISTINGNATSRTCIFAPFLLSTLQFNSIIVCVLLWSAFTFFFLNSRE